MGRWGGLPDIVRRVRKVCRPTVKRTSPHPFHGHSSGDASPCLAVAAARASVGESMVNFFVALKRNEHEERQALVNPRQDWDLKPLIERA